MAMSSASDPTSPTSPTSPTTLKQKLKSSLRLPWLRHHNGAHHGAAASTTTPISTPTSAPAVNDHKQQKLRRTYSPTWLKNAEFKEKCRNLINRIGHSSSSQGPSHGHGHGHRHRRCHSHGHGQHGNGHGRRHSADFRYDPSSYALNFDEDGSQFDDDLPNFSARLPPSPTAHSSRKIDFK